MYNLRKLFSILILLIVTVINLQPLFLYAQEDVTTLEKEVKELSDKLKDVDSQIAEINQKISDLDKEIDTLSLENEGLTTTIADLENELVTSENQAKDALVTLQKINNSNMLYEFEIAPDGSFTTDYFRKISLLNMYVKSQVAVVDQVAQKKSELLYSQDQFKTNSLDNEAKKAELEKEKKSFDKIIADTQDQVDELNQKIAKLEEEELIQTMTANSDGYLDTEEQKAVMSAVGISEADQVYVSYIIDHESTWNYLAVNSSSGAYGLCQALPASKLESAGSDWKTNPITQMKWCNNYAMERYGSWQNAHSFWLENKWW